MPYQVFPTRKKNPFEVFRTGDNTVKVSSGMVYWGLALFTPVWANKLKSSSEPNGAFDTDYEAVNGDILRLNIVENPDEGGEEVAPTIEIGWGLEEPSSFFLSIEIAEYVDETTITQNISSDLIIKVRTLADLSDVSSAENEPSLFLATPTEGESNDYSGRSIELNDLPNGAISGYVLTADPDGNPSYQQGGGGVDGFSETIIEYVDAGNVATTGTFLTK